MRALLTLLLALSSAALAATPPALSESSVLRPEFQLAKTRLLAGTAFLLDLDGEIVVVTAYHLFGPMGGLEKQIGSRELPTAVKSATLKDAWTATPAGAAGPPFPLPDAAPMGGPTAALDLAVLPYQPTPPAEGAPAPTPHPLPLAGALPKLGETVWVAAPLVNGTAETPRLLEAKVVEVNENWLFYSYTKTDLDLTATSGAPVLNASGQVVGINLGGGKMDAELIGSANPIAAHKDRLQEAARRGKTQR